MCIFEDIVDEKLLLDKSLEVLIGEAYSYHTTQVLSNSVENSIRVG